jgi:hypothetical protein
MRVGLGTALQTGTLALKVTALSRFDAKSSPCGDSDFGAIRSPPTLVGVNAMSLRPDVQIDTAIDDLATKPIEGGPGALVTPLRQFFAIAEDVELGVPKDVVSIAIEQIGHRTHSFRCFQLQRINAR